MPTSPDAVPENVQKVFAIWDAAGTGYIDVRGLREALGMLGMDSTISEADIGSLLPDTQQLDVRGFHRTVQRLLDLQAQGKQHGLGVPIEVRQAFTKLDTSGLGVLDRAQQRRALAELGLPTDRPEAHQLLLKAEARGGRYSLLDFHALAQELAAVGGKNPSVRRRRPPRTPPATAAKHHPSLQPPVAPTARPASQLPARAPRARTSSGPRHTHGRLTS